MKSRVINTLLCIFALSLPLQSKEPAEIRIELSSKIARAPTYISKIKADRSTLSAGYQNTLQQVLEFDFDNGGCAHLVEYSPEKEKLAANLTPDRASWRKYGAAYVVSGEIEGKTLSLHVLNVSTGSLGHFRQIPLTGDLKKDRFKIHQISDAIHANLWNRGPLAATHILYSYYVPDGKNGWKAEIWICDWDGKNPTQITHDGDYSITPAFIPGPSGKGSSEFLYVSYKMGQPKIYRAPLATGKGERLTELRGNQLLPTVSPDKSKIALISDADGRADLFMIESHNGGFLKAQPSQLYSFPLSSQSTPTFSPGGDRIAFVSDKGGSPRIYLIDAKQSKKRQDPTLLIKQTRNSFSPAWSPDGTKLVYSAKVDDVRQIWVYNFNTGTETQLTFGGTNKENPTWAPDSLHVVYNSVDDQVSDLYVLDTETMKGLKITQGTGKKHYPSWGKALSREE